MRFLPFAIVPAVFSGLLLTSNLTANSQSRYEAPPKAVLSGDLASPWMLQLHRKPGSGLRSSHYLKQFEPKQRLTRKKRTKSRAVLRSAVRKKPAKRQQIASVEPARKKQNPPKPSLDPRFLPQQVDYHGSHKPGTLVVSTAERHLYLVLPDGKARRYGVGVGKQGFTWSGTHKITRKREWPGWTPPPEMIVRERAKGRELPAHMPGGPENPLGARALYIGSTLYRIHGTNQPWTIGKAVSSGCIRMRNEDVMDLYDRIGVGTRVVVL